ncbi:MAG: hypothetical protein KDA45_00270 [Planctomycetales bacterium]|nr:hypothetical protein [Planctomycetales bacterium]
MSDTAVRQKLEPATTRWLCLFLVVLAAIVQLSRIVQVESSTGEVPFHSANDRSRWCTIAALAVTGSYEIDEVLEIRDPKSRRRTWYSIDLVRHRGADGKQHYYSSKPPLLPTLYTGVYLGIRALTGSTLMNDPFFVVRTLLVVVNLLPLLAFWWLLVQCIQREPLSAWAAIVSSLFVAWGTYLSTFVSTLNNHLPAAIAVGLSLWCVQQIALQRDRRWRWFLLAGLSTSFGAANELPALSWLAAVGALLLVVDARRTLLGYVPALLPVALAFFGTNYLAHGEFNPAYAHRSVGEKLFSFETESGLPLEQLPLDLVIEQMRQHGIEASSQAVLRPARRAGVYEFWDAEREHRVALRRDKEPAGGRVNVYAWGDWYDYPGSYWTSDRKQGVDKGEPNVLRYIFHSLIGHHGIFSLTPFWLLSLLGGVVVWRQRTTLNVLVEHRLLLTAAIAATSLVAIGFYLGRPLEDRNYGGVSSGFRWAFWLTPLWIWLALQGLQVVQARWARRLVEVLLGISVFSACFPWDNPWTSPWLMQYGQYLGWLAAG